MKKHLKQLISFSLALMIGFFSPLSVYATDDHPWQGGLGLQLYYNKEDVIQYIKDSAGFWNYAANQAGTVLIDHDFKKFAENSDAFDELTDKMGVYKDTSGNIQGVYLPEDFMAQLKELLDQYAKENEPYYMGYTYSLYTASLSSFGNQKNVYDTVKNLIEDSPNGLIRVSINTTSVNGVYGVMVGVSEYLDIKDISFVKHAGYAESSACMYHNSTWKMASIPNYTLFLSPDDEAVKTLDEFKQRSTGSNSDHSYLSHSKFAGISTASYYDTRFSGFMGLSSYQKMRFRIYYNTDDFMNATLGRRHVYYTSKYYEYTPADVSVSTKELEQGVKDLNTAMDKLLEQIDKDTPESEVENLLQQILDELKNSGSGSGGGEGPGTDPGTGGGTVDMSTTNSWLSKIYAKVCEIFDRIGQRDTFDQGSVSENSIGLSDINNVLKLIWANTNVIVENLMPEGGQDSVSGNSIDLSHTNSILDSIKTGLDDIHETLKKIKRWTVVDTIVDGADAIADWFDMIHDLISDADSGAESVVSTLSSALGDSLGLMKTKFPFSIPWDILFFVTALSAEPEVPQFSIPFDFEISALDLEVHYDLELDFTPFQWLSDLSRLLLSMTYAVGLMKLTFNVSTVEKEG